MHILTSRWRLIAILGVILVAGFVAVNLAHYHVSRNSIRSTLIHNELPLTSNNIYAEIQAGLLRPIYISSLMANDTFVKDWMLGGEREERKIVKYLAEIREKYDVSSTFLVSARTLRYYHYKGTLKTVSRQVPKDAWFFSMESHPAAYRVDVDTDEAKSNDLTIFVNHKVYDYDGNFIAVTGLGLDVMSIGELIRRYSENYRRNIYFVDRSGNVTRHLDPAQIGRINILKVPGISSVAADMLTGEEGFLSYRGEGGEILVSYRFIPELNWYLVVEQPESEALAPLRQALVFNLMVSGAVTLLALVISGYAVTRFQSRLQELARTDRLTGVCNRLYFDIVFSHLMGRASRGCAPFTLAIVDVDNLKAVNDREGHLEGDRLLREIVASIRHRLRASDTLCRWGGDEFVILLEECDLATGIRLLEEIRRRVGEDVRPGLPGIPASISAGLAEYRQGDDGKSLLARADRALYRAKEGGRDRVCGEPPVEEAPA